MNESPPSRPHSSISRPQSALRQGAVSARNAAARPQRPASAHPSNNSFAARPSTPTRPLTARAAPSSAGPAASAPSSRGPSSAASSAPGTPQIGFRDPRLQAALREAMGRATRSHGGGGGSGGELGADSPSYFVASTAAATATPAAATAAAATPPGAGSVATHGRKGATQAVLLRPRSAAPVHHPQPHPEPLPPSLSANDLGRSPTQPHAVSFGRTVYTSNGTSVKSATVRPASAASPARWGTTLDPHARTNDHENESEEGNDGYPLIDSIHVPAAVAASTKPKRAPSSGGARGRGGPGAVEAQSWAHAADLRAVPLETDQEQVLMHATLHQIELARRALPGSSPAHRAALEARGRPWRQGDALERDSRWHSGAHRSAVGTLRASLDHMLHTWRTKDQSARAAAYDALPERQRRPQAQARRNDAAVAEGEGGNGGESEGDSDAENAADAAPRTNTHAHASNPACHARAHAREDDDEQGEDDPLYAMMSRLEHMIAELRVYDQVFKRITLGDEDADGNGLASESGLGSGLARARSAAAASRPGANPGPSQRPDADPICPSAPLRDLLDRIRVAHSSTYPCFDALFTELRRRLRAGWSLREMARGKAESLAHTRGAMAQWQEDLEAERDRSQRRGEDLEQTKSALARLGDNAHLGGGGGIAPAAAVATRDAFALYDRSAGKLVRLSVDQVESVRAQPVQWYGENTDEEEEQQRQRGRAAAAAAGPGSPSSSSVRAERRRVKLSRTRASQARQAEVVASRRAWRLHRLGELAALESRPPHGLTEPELREQERLLREHDHPELVPSPHARGREEEKTQVSDDDEDEDDDGEGAGSDRSDEESTDSDPSVPPSAGVLRRRARLALLSPAARHKLLYARVSRKAARALTSRPLLAVRPLASGDVVRGDLFANSDYYSFTMEPDEPGVWVRLVVNDPDGDESCLVEMQLSYGCPPTRRSRFFVTSTRAHVGRGLGLGGGGGGGGGGSSSNSCEIDLRDHEMTRGRMAAEQLRWEEQQRERARRSADAFAASGFAAGSAAAVAPAPLSPPDQRGPGRWYLRVQGRGLSLKKYTLEFRIRPATDSVLRAALAAERVLADMDAQAHWRDALADRALVVEQAAQRNMQALLPRPPSPPWTHPDERCELDHY